ncbi:hypothetical protein ACIQJX_17765 [Streptomyces griseoviridis]
MSLGPPHITSGGSAWSVRRTDRDGSGKASLVPGLGKFLDNAADTVDSADTADSADTVDSADTADTVDSADTADAVDSADTADATARRTEPPRAPAGTGAVIRPTADRPPR